MGLIERLRDGPYTLGAITGEILELNDAADALERLKGYAVHDEDCALGLHGPACSCGLSTLLREIDGC